MREHKEYKMESILSYEEQDEMCENIDRFFGVEEDSDIVVTVHEAHEAAVEANLTSATKLYTFGPKICTPVASNAVILEDAKNTGAYISNPEFAVLIDGKYYCKEGSILTWKARKKFKGLLVAVEIAKINGEDAVEKSNLIIDVAGRKVELIEAEYLGKKYTFEKSKVNTVSNSDIDIIDSPRNLKYYGIISWNGKTYKPGLRGYHTGERREAGPQGEIKVGVEIEKEKKGMRSKISADYLRDRFKWHAETDSSLSSDRGYELVSPIYSLDKPEKMFEDLEELRDLIDTPDETPSGRAGGHINVSIQIPRDELDKNDGYVGKALLKRISGFVGLLYAMYPNRSDNSYCRAFKLSEYIKYPSKKAFYPKRDRLEIRIFPEVQTVDDLKNRLLLVKYMITQATTRTDVVVGRMFNPETNLHKLLNDMGYNVKELAQKVMEMNAKFDNERFTATVHKKLGEYGVKILTKVKRTKKEKDTIIASVNRTLAGLIDDEDTLNEIRNSITRGL